MFENIFKKHLAKYSDDLSLNQALWKEINQQYSAPSRHYHSLKHLDHLLAELIPIQKQILDWDVMLLSIAYHDIIYNILETNNEEESAKFALSRLALLSLSSFQKDACSRQILATKGHSITEDSDTNFFIDADLTILGAREEIYLEYAQNVRKEYNFYTDTIYNQGRKKVLRHFLDMPNIFKTNYFGEKYENQARINLQSELKTLYL